MPFDKKSGPEIGKTGGRPKGKKDTKPRAPYRTKKRREKALAEAAQLVAAEKAAGNIIRNIDAANALITKGNLDPLNFFLALINDPTMPLDIRIRCARYAAPYCHPTLAAVSFQGKITHQSHEEALEELDKGPELVNDNTTAPVSDPPAIPGPQLIIEGAILDTARSRATSSP